MAAATAADSVFNSSSNGLDPSTRDSDDPFLGDGRSVQQPYLHRFSSRFELDNTELGTASSPSQVKRVLEAHLLETERRLQDAQKLGTSLLEQQSELQDKLREVEQQQDEAEISPELKQRLASISREHDDVSREIARSLLAPKSRVISGEEKPTAESTTFTSQATGSPTKISAPSRRQRNQPTNRAGDLQFAADISTSLLAQVRQLQAAVAERDDTIKSANAERSKLEQDVQMFAQRLRTHDENEQRYKDANWNLEAQNHELLTVQREAADKEKRVSAALALAYAEKTRLLSEIEETRLAHSKALEQNVTSKKAHETEMHSLKRDFDVADGERSALQHTIDDLTAQNQELAKAVAARYRNQSPQRQPDFDENDDRFSKDISTPEHSPPPSPTKATPRHGGLESETLKSSLHHAHRMIQNLKGNIHREKTEKIELKRMLQDARDELEQRRNETSLSSGSKKQKTRNEVFKKPMRPDMLGTSRRARTDVELQDGDWEDLAADSPSHAGVTRYRPAPSATDLSDAYQTAHETESNFETADERHTTESEAFETGVESLAGDSTDDLTETESTAPRSLNRSSVRHTRPALAFKPAGERTSYLSTASTSDGEGDDYLQTPVQSQSRYKLKNGRSSAIRQTQIFEGTPDSVRTQMTSQDSPATVTNGRSPAPAEQSLFAELEGINDTSSNFSTPARSGTIDIHSPSSVSDTPSKSAISDVPHVVATKPAMVDSTTMTDPWQPQPVPAQAIVPSLPTYASVQTMTDMQTGLEAVSEPRAPSIGDFPLPPSIPVSPARQVDNSTQYTPRRPLQVDNIGSPQQHFGFGTQHTPSKALQDSPVRADNTFVTSSKSVWDESRAAEAGSLDQKVATTAVTSKYPLAYSGVLSQDTVPQSPHQPNAVMPSVLGYSSILSMHTEPITPPPSFPPTIPVPAVPDDDSHERPKSSEKAAAGAATGGILAGAAAALGLSWSRGTSSKVEDGIVDHDANDSQIRRGNVNETSETHASQNDHLALDADLKSGMPLTISRNDQGSQTMLTSEQIEQALFQQPKGPVIPLGTPIEIESAPALPQRSPIRSVDRDTPTIVVPSSPPLRPSSATSHRSSVLAGHQHPPLPSDYRTNIAKANSMTQIGAARREPTTQAVGTIMGPPAIPASAMRRPKTPSESVRSPGREIATPRTSRSVQNHRSLAGSQLSRRSSVSSFASELDERFNIRADVAGHSYEAAPGTDPRMIQAITQTMIGEYLWKYTRKTVGKDMSNNRHRRYFWVHPYTKTLYWSATDPSTAGSKESKSRSVPIESIRVVSDDNPMPPGLHRKSLEITAPGRKVKITAQTGQRHETWFNALSYLLLRGEPPDMHGAYATGGNEITRDDIDEFRVGGYDPHLVPNSSSRMSMSSYNSRTTAGTSKRVSGAIGTSQRQAMPSNLVSTGRGNSGQQSSLARNSSVPPIPESSRASRADEPQQIDKDRTIRASSVSRVSRMLGSITGQTSRHDASDVSEHRHTGRTRGVSQSESGSIYNASVVSATRDSAEEARQEMLRQEAMGLGGNGGLENVRACCDGKHDVSTLNHNTRHSDRHGALSSMSDRINRSMSKRV